MRPGEAPVVHASAKGRLSLDKEARHSRFLAVSGKIWAVIVFVGSVLDAVLIMAVLLSSLLR